ncbi:MAG TPA: 50S ribosomal protein L25/general stress protein Ctc [Candidatus Avibacteroides excrementipullorum]|jgi:large subunit ribosomal protein L25|nr:50S ribosomal protein L25/general stress protein Ctc [Candidatus Avibacteroides excrementipullorum]
MKTFGINGTVRNEFGKKASRAYRKEEVVPCEIYGKGENRHILVSYDELRRIVFTPHIYVVDINIEGQDVKTIIKEVQFHPVKDTILHIDFLEIDDQKPIEINIPVKLEGLADGVKAGGKLNLQKRLLKVKGLYTDIPEKLEIDVTNLKLGKSIQVGALNFDKLELLDAKDAVVCSVQLTRAARGAAAAASAE